MHLKHKRTILLLFICLFAMVCVWTQQTLKNKSNTATFENIFTKFSTYLKQQILMPASAMNMQANGTAICLDGNVLVVLENEEAAKQALTIFIDTLQKNNSDEILSIVPEGDLTYRSGYFEQNLIVSIEHAAELLSGTPSENALYTVKENETLQILSQKFNIPTSDLIKINHLSGDTIQAGDKIWIDYPEPLLPMIIQKKQVYTQYIPAERIYQYNDALFTGEQKTIQAGKKGEKEISAIITYRNMEEASRDVVSEIYLAQPQNEIIEVGTKARNTATGSFIRPVQTGEITSAFGIRERNNHKGVDIGVNEGTPVYASDSGVIIFSGWSEGYGNTIIIDHQNGFSTLYAHCSQLIGKKDTKIEQGTVVALSGNTGNSTGPHLHFEIRKEDVCVNPALYCSL